MGAPTRTAAGLDRADLLGFGRVQGPGTGSYAARRVWHYADRGDGERVLKSHLMVASDEPNSAAPDVEAEGTTWRPYRASGCHGCGRDCGKHGDGIAYAAMGPGEIQHPDGHRPENRED